MASIDMLKCLCELLTFVLCVNLFLAPWIAKVLTIFPVRKYPTKVSYISQVTRNVLVIKCVVVGEIYMILEGKRRILSGNLNFSFDEYTHGKCGANTSFCSKCALLSL